MGRMGRMGIRYLYLYYAQYLAHTMDLKQYGDFYGFELALIDDDDAVFDEYNTFKNGFGDGLLSNYNEFMQQFDGGELIKYGLYHAMIRYLFVVYPEIYDIHHNVLNKK